MTKNTPGEYIKKYRKAAKLSQLDLEISTGFASGSLSKIENGTVNPTKETIYKIIDTLELSPVQSAKLFKINLDYFKNVLDTSNRLNNIKEFDELIKIACDDIVNALSIEAVGIYLREGDILKYQAVNLNKFTKFALKLLPFPADKVSFDLNSEEENAMTEAFKKNKIVLVDHLYDLCKPVIPKKLANTIQNFTKIETLLTIPMLDENNDPMGIIIFAKKGKSDFNDEMIFLNAFTFMLTKVILRMKEK